MRGRKGGKLDVDARFWGPGGASKGDDGALKVYSST